MSFDPLSWLASGPKAAEKVLDGAISGIDKLVYTEEERADLKAKFADQWLELQKIMGEETSIRGVTRRLLALMFCGSYVLLSLAAVAVWKLDYEYANFMWDVANGQFGNITMAVGVFYFGPYVLEKLGLKKA